MFAEGANIAEEHLPRVTQGLAFFEEKLKDQNYVTGQHMTIAGTVLLTVCYLLITSFCETIIFRFQESFEQAESRLLQILVN